MNVVTQSWVIVTLTIRCKKITNSRQHLELIEFEELSPQLRQRPRGKEGNLRFANEEHLRFVFVASGFHCGRGKARYVSELFSFSQVCHEFLKRCCLNMSQLSKYGSTWPNKWLWQRCSQVVYRCTAMAQLRMTAAITRWPTTDLPVNSDYW